MLKRIVEPTIVVVEDDPDDRMLITEAAQEAALDCSFHFVEGGEALFELLEDESAPRPGLLLLDLQLPRMNGKEVLERLRSDPRHHALPVVVLTTSWSEEDIRDCYALGANSFIIKPVMFAALVSILDKLVRYWFELVELPVSS